MPLRLRLSFLMFLQWAVPGSLLPLYSVHLKNLGFSEMAIASCCAAQAVAAVVSSLVAGQVADRWLSAEKAMACCAILAGLDLWLIAELHELVPMFLATLFFWMVTGPMLILGTTISFAHLDKPEQQFGSVRLWGTIGWVAICWLVGFWLASPDWLSAGQTWLRPWAPRPMMVDSFRMGGAIAFLLAGYTLTLPATPPGRKVAPGETVAPLEAIKLLRGGTFATYCACVLGACITFSFTTQTTPLLLQELGIERHWLTPAMTVAQSSEVLCLALLPGLLLRLGLRGTMLLGLGAWLCAMCVLAVGRPVELVVASLGLNGLYVTGFLIAGQVYLNSQGGEALRASVQGLFSFVNGLGLLAGNLLAGWLRDATEGELPVTFAVGAGITVALLILFVAGFRYREAGVGALACSTSKT
jgi:predicted MFS family arabinose efflux permease